jgi:hypothetical protein
MPSTIGVAGTAISAVSVRWSSKPQIGEAEAVSTKSWELHFDLQLEGLQALGDNHAAKFAAVMS